MSHSQSKDRIAELIETLPAQKQPQRDLYKGIEYAISTADKTRVAGGKQHNVIYGLAASICLVAVVAYFSYQSGVSQTGQQLVVQLTEQHAQQKELLLASLAGTPQKTQNWQQQLAELDDAANAIKKALENEPNNVALLKMLKKVHEQQIALIERVHAPAWQSI